MASYIADRAEEIGAKTSVVSTLDIAVLTLLNITDELFQERSGMRDDINRLEDSAQ